MKTIREIISGTRLYGLLVLSILFLATACSQTQDGLEIPTATNMATVSSTESPTPSGSNNTIFAAASPEQFPIIELNSSGVTGTCAISRSHDGDLIWKISLTNVIPGHTIFMGIFDKNVGLVDGVEVDAKREVVRSGRHKSSGPPPGTTMFCRGGDNASGPIATTLDFVAP
jgi:hypothetical protein